MANRIYIQIKGNKEIIDVPLLTDVTLEIGSQFSSLGELAPALGTFIDIAKLLDVSGGRMSKLHSDFYNAMDLPLWKRTEPMKFQTTLAFYTQDDPKKDVWDKMTYLMSLSILTKNSDQSYSFPGLSIHSFSKLLTKQDTSVSSNASIQEMIGGIQTSSVKDVADFEKQLYESNSKFISIAIPGVVYLDTAMILTCTPTFSKQKTTSGYPLWGNLEIQVSGLYPASTQIFKDTETFTTQQKINTTVPTGLNAFGGL